MPRKTKAQKEADQKELNQLEARLVRLNKMKLYDLMVRCKALEGLPGGNSISVRAVLQAQDAWFNEVNSGLRFEFWYDGDKNNLILGETSPGELFDDFSSQLDRMFDEHVKKVEATKRRDTVLRKLSQADRDDLGMGNWQDQSSSNPSS